MGILPAKYNTSSCPEAFVGGEEEELVFVWRLWKK